jgi:hypothetical protein
MNSYCKSYAQIDLASLHYVTFIELHVIIWTESLTFGLDQFMNKSVDRGKTKDHFLLIKDNLFAAALLHNKTYEVEFEDLSHEVLEYFS